MRIKRLLSAASLVALMSANAHAIEFANTVVGAGTMPLATELCLDKDGVTVDTTFTIDVKAEGTFNYPNDMTVTIDLPAWATFSAALTGGNPGPGINLPNGSGITGVQVLTGGAAGDSQVVIKYTSTNSAATVFTLNQIPLTVSSCPTNDGIQVTAVDSNAIGTPGVQPRYIINSAKKAHYDAKTTAKLFPGCKSVFKRTLKADTTPKDIAFNGSPATYDTFIAGASTPIGTYDYAIDPSVDYNGMGTFLPASAVKGIDVDVTVDDMTGMLGASSSAGGSGTFASNTTSFTDAYAAGVNTVSVTDQPTGSKNAAIVSQNTKMTTTAKFTAASNLTDKDPKTLAMGDLVRDGVIFGRFDWSGGSVGAGSNTVLRGTGFPESETVNYTLNLTNAVDPANNGSYFGSVKTNAGGELHLTSRSDYGISGLDFTRADALICFEIQGIDYPKTDIDRMMLRNDILSAYNDGSNNGKNLVSGDFEPNNDEDNNTNIPAGPNPASE